MTRPEQIVVVGAGLAGHRAAVSLRDQGFDGRVLPIDAQSELPYDRPPLSKAVLAGAAPPESTYFTTHEKLAEVEIEPLLGHAVTALDLDERRLEVGGRRIAFDGLRRQRVEHWTNAVEQARHVARNLLHGESKPFLGSNYVWSDQYDTRIQFAGIAVAEPEIVAGSLDEGKFLGWYREDDRLVGVVGIGQARLVAKSRRLIEQRATVAQAREALFPT